MARRTRSAGRKPAEPRQSKTKPHVTDRSNEPAAPEAPPNNVRGVVGGLAAAAAVAGVLALLRRAGLGSGEVTLLALIEVASVACAWHLWRRGGVRAGRAFSWTLIALVPLAGPIFYGGFFEMPSVLPENLRSRRGGGLGFGREN